ncbi:LysE family translocator [Belnapia rosea]|uniref:LysE family translocator n=1 Tax=Belnapia rosea TaxID=938405 RepID=UPI0008800948|nr:LysE family translocator [Belnapia rosea]SDB73682.1 Threonine/homoserine/homoserine lactone efflux protein [Belnapia rosea]
MSLLAEFFLTVLLLELTPGPNMAYLALLSLSRGARPALVAVLGVAIGLAVHALVAALGAGALIARSPPLYETLRWCGVAYLLWLAYEGWRGEADSAPGTAGFGDAGLRLLWRGFATNLLNPKSVLFFVSVVPRFVVEPQGEPQAAVPTVIVQMAILGTLYVAVATAVHVLVVLLAAQLRPWLVAGARRDRVRRMLSLLLAGVAAWLALSTSR